MIMNRPDFRAEAALAKPDDFAAALKAMYYKGMREATWEWAWHKDGVQRVGCGVRTLAQAYDIINEEEARP